MIIESIEVPRESNVETYAKNLFSGMALTRSDLQTFTKIQSVALIVVDDELASVPISLVNVFDHFDAASFELFCEFGHTVGLEVEM